MRQELLYRINDTIAYQSTRVIENNVKILQSENKCILVYHSNYFMRKNFYAYLPNNLFCKQT